MLLLFIIHTHALALLSCPKLLNTIYASQTYNFQKWSIRENVINRTIEGSYDKEVTAFKSWYNERLAWMNGEISKW